MAICEGGCWTGPCRLSKVRCARSNVIFGRRTRQTGGPDDRSHFFWTHPYLLGTLALWFAVLFSGLVATTLPDRALAQTTLTGTTIGGPTFNRPDFRASAGGPRCEGNRDNHPYAAHEITITDSPVDIVISTSNFDSMMFLYPGDGFDPNRP